MLKRTAKSCGSDAPRLASRFAEASRPNRAWTKPYPQDDGGKTAWSPRRARRKPLKPLRGECRTESGGPVVTTLVCLLHISHARLRVHWAPGIPCALYFLWADGLCKTRTHRAAGMRRRI